MSAATKKSTAGTRRLLAIILFTLTPLIVPIPAQSDEGPTSHGGWGSDLYSETYRDYLSHNLIEFQRIGEDFTTPSFDHLTDALGDGKTKLYAQLIHEVYDVENLYSTELGIEKEILPNLKTTMAFRLIDFNDGNYRDTQFRLGSYGGWTHTLYSDWLVFDSYGELYAILPGKSSLQLAGDGFVNVAYRAYEANNWILDPVVLDARVYRASNPAYAGQGYSALNLGPKITYWWKTSIGFGSIGLFLAKSLVWSSQGDGMNDDWFLLTIGVRF
jgi:hypothetical protein